MPIKIKNILKNSLACRAGISCGETIVSINGQSIDDFLALQFYASDPVLEIVLNDGTDSRKRVTIKQDWYNKLGIEPEEHQIRSCVNGCIFCFIDQMPPNLRDSLYVKDDDYLFSFVFGNYISLSNMSEKDFQRLIEQRITPLYVSVHSTNSQLRKEIMGYRHDFDLLGKLRILSDNGIDFHTQIVIMPEVNDGKELINTLEDLVSDELNTLSIGLVPVGLTKYRDNLYPLRTISSKEAEEIIDIAALYREEKDFRELYLADELFLLAGKEIPPSDYYDDFCQIENGIGMIRETVENWKLNRDSFIAFLGNRSILFVTGKLAEPTIAEFCNDINRRKERKTAEVLAVENRFFGETITVSGLLTMQDIEEKLAEVLTLPDFVAFSSNMFNTEGYTLDGIQIDDLPQRLQRDIIIVNELWVDFEILNR